MEGPYRDLGSGFARLTGPEGARRNPSRLRYVEDALLELLRNARDAGATGIYVASTLKSRRYRTLTVIDDGAGVPETHSHLIFEPGVTSRHLHPVLDSSGATHGAGLSLYHIRNAAVEARLVSASSPTALKATFDTHTLPERALQSGSRPSRSNLQATLAAFANPSSHKEPAIYHGPPARILATLLDNHIIQRPRTPAQLRQRAFDLGLEVSLRTVQRVWRGEVRVLGEVSREVRGEVRRRREVRRGAEEGPVLVVGEEERGAVADILRRAARASFLEIEELRVESRPGEISLRARVYEPEEDYE